MTALVTLLLPLLGDPRHFFYGDTQAAYYGWWYHLGDELRAGRWPLLDPQAWRAGNLAAEGQWGLYSPLVMAIGLVATLTGHVLLWASVVKVLLALVGVWGVYALVRSYAAPPAAAYVASVVVPLGGMTQYLDLPSWAAGLMIWALLPWAWWGLRKVMIEDANPLLALGPGYLLVTVGYVYGTIMLIFVLIACLLDCAAVRDRAAALRVTAVGVLAGLLTFTVYLPGVLTAPVTVRSGAIGGFGGKFTTDPLTMFSSLLPTAATPGTAEHLLPYAYTLWLLPVLLWVDYGRLRRGWRPLAGLLFLAGITLLVVDGPARLGPLRWPLRLQTLLVQMLAVLCVVLVSRFLVRAGARRRLAAGLAWVVLAGVVALVRVPALWWAHALSVVTVAGGLVGLWVLLGRRRLTAAAAFAGSVTVVLLAFQHAVFPTPPSPERNLPAQLADYQGQVPAAQGDILVVGDVFDELTTDPAAAGDFLAGSAWYLGPHPVQNTYTTISFDTYYERYCIHYSGFTCPELLDTLFTTEPVTGLPRVDLLSVSTLQLVRDDFPAARLSSPPTGWHVAATSSHAVTWVRDRPVPTAGGPVWSSPGTAVSLVDGEDRTVRLRVDRVPAGGGRVVLSRLAWPGYTTDVGTLADPVDGYLLTVDLPATAAGQVVTVHFSPPGWPVEVLCWWLAVLVGLGWAGRSWVAARRGG